MGCTHTRAHIPFVWKWAKEAQAGRSGFSVQHQNLLEHLATPHRLLFSPLPVCLMPNTAFVVLAVFVVIFCCFVLGFVRVVYARRGNWGGKSGKSFLLESRFLSVTDRCGTMKANHNVPQTSKIPVFSRLLATTHNNLSPDVDSSKQGGKKLDETEADDKEATIQTARGGRGRRRGALNNQT